MIYGRPNLYSITDTMPHTSSDWWELQATFLLKVQINAHRLAIGSLVFKAWIGTAKSVEIELALPYASWDKKRYVQNPPIQSATA